MRVVACRPGCLVLPALVEKVTWREKEDKLRPTNSMLGVFDTTFFRNLVRNTDCTFTQNWHTLRLDVRFLARLFGQDKPNLTDKK